MSGTQGREADADDQIQAYFHLNEHNHNALDYSIIHISGEIRISEMLVSCPKSPWIRRRDTVKSKFCIFIGIFLSRRSSVEMCEVHFFPIWLKEWPRRPGLYALS